MKPITATSAVEFLIWLLIAASAIAILAKRLRAPYTVALVAGGLMLSALRLPRLSPLDPGQRPDWLTPDVILIVFLPALVFEGGMKLNVRDLLRNSAPLLLLANLGVLLAALVTGYLVHWTTGLPVQIALLFGAIISATDPISVLAIFKDLRMDKRLSLIVEGESLLNDGTAAALFQILLAGIISGHLGVSKGVGQFLFAVLGGVVLGSFLGYAGSRLTRTIDDPEVQITLTAVVAYSSYLLAYQLHLSGIIATASAGLIVGNLGTKNCCAQTKTALESFWAYVAFIMNALVFLLIGLEIHVDELLRSWRPVLLAVGAVLVGRALSVYLLVPVSNALTEKIPLVWQHVIVWGGLRGALALALALSLDSTFPDRARVLDLTFGVVAFSILVQGLTIKPLLKRLRLANVSQSIGDSKGNGTTSMAMRRV
ncbi:MAG: cation:proton antiporter [Candidatus Sulfotelmatobacter sp.]